MSSRKPLVIIAGKQSTLPDTDSLLAGEGIDASTAVPLLIGSTNATSVEIHTPTANWGINANADAVLIGRTNVSVTDGISLYTNGADGVQIQSADTDVSITADSTIRLNSFQVTFVENNNPTINQEDLNSGGGDGHEFTIRAQHALGAGARGGDLTLSAGSGEDGGTLHLLAGEGSISGFANITMTADVVSMNVNELTFIDSITNPTITQVSHAGPGAPLFIFAQSSSSDVGGNLQLQAGSSNGAVGGNVQLVGGDAPLEVGGDVTGISGIGDTSGSVIFETANGDTTAGNVLLRAGLGGSTNGRVDAVVGPGAHDNFTSPYALFELDGQEVLAALVVSDGVSSASGQTSFIMESGTNDATISSSTRTSGTGGGIALFSQATLSGTGGILQLVSGSSLDGVGGQVQLIAADGSDAGGDVQITAGDGPDGFFGNIFLNAGARSGSDDGSVVIRSSYATFYQTVLSPHISQRDDTTDGPATAQTLTVMAQSETGSQSEGMTIGGALVLSGGTAGIGGDATLLGGHSNGAGQLGGNATVAGGGSDDDTGGSVNIQSGAGGNGISGNVFVVTLDGLSSGGILLQTGSSSEEGGGITGGIELVTGTTATESNGGSISLTTGNVGTDSNVGTIILTTGEADGGLGGLIQAQTGAFGPGWDLQPATSSLDIRADVETLTSLDGTCVMTTTIGSAAVFVSLQNLDTGTIDFTLRPEDNTDGNGGELTIQAQSSTDGNGGSMLLQAGFGIASDGGSVTIEGGQATGGNGGTVFINAGVSDASTDGAIVLNLGTNVNNNLEINNIITDSPVFGGGSIPVPLNAELFFQVVINGTTVLVPGFAPS